MKYAFGPSVGCGVVHTAGVVDTLHTSRHLLCFRLHVSNYDLASLHVTSYFCLHMYSMWFCVTPMRALGTVTLSLVDNKQISCRVVSCGHGVVWCGAVWCGAVWCGGVGWGGGCGGGAVWGAPPLLPHPPPTSRTPTPPTLGMTSLPPHPSVTRSHTFSTNTWGRL